MDIPFNKPYVGRNARRYLEQAISANSMSGRGVFSEKCEAWLRHATGAKSALLTHSGTGALELAVLLANLASGDEVIMSSFTFASMANAVVLRGGVPVFVDIRPDTLNLDETLIEAAIGARTRAIMPMHYVGVGCDMPAITRLGSQYGLSVIEDAAHAILATHAGRPLGSIGDFAALSFHDTKNIQCGEGGALLVNDAAAIERAEILLEKGTNRTAYFRGTVDKYHWVDLGSSFVLSEPAAALLWSQLEEAAEITRRRLAIWQRYHEALAPLEAEGHLTRPVVPRECQHSGHGYYILIRRAADRMAVIQRMRAAGINTPFHYVPLHNAPAGVRFCRTAGQLTVTEDRAARLIRLPIWIGMEAHVGRVVDTLAAALTSL